SFNTERIEHLYKDAHLSDVNLFLHYGDLSDSGNLRKVLETIAPDEFYNLGAQSHVRVSFDQPEYTADIVGLGALRVLEAIRDHQDHTGRTIKYYQAGSSEMFGKVVETPQSETTPFYPRSPYSCAKLYAHWQTINYRESYGLFAANGILFNHESPRRGETFVTRKITRAATRIKLGLQEKLYLGNLDAKRDWGFAGDYVKAMWMMLQCDEPGDYVVATGEAYSVKEFLERVFSQLGMDWNQYVEQDERYFRPAEVDILLGDASKAERAFGWKAETSFDELVAMMVESDMRIAEKEKLIADSGLN
ncbi:MAG: GDP-mannose 4,6-dehydratase, partial [Victivallales bacterium]|nr:GDP-mannose 4,6-dehydratase [Victivallales bacterium]